MKNAGKGKILAVLRWRGRYCALLAGLVLLVLLLGLKLLLLLVVVGRNALQRAQHEERRMWWQVSSESVQSSAPQHKHTQISFNKLVVLPLLFYFLPDLSSVIQPIPRCLKRKRNSLLDSTPNHGAPYNIELVITVCPKPILTHPSWLCAKQHFSTGALHSVLNTAHPSLWPISRLLPLASSWP